MTPEDNDALSIQGVTSTSNKILQFGTALDDHYGSSDEPRSIVVSVKEPQSHGDGVVHKHTTYKVDVEFVWHDGRHEKLSVRRRYSQFHWLYDVLVASFPGALVPPPHGKAYNFSVIMKEDETFILERCRSLDLFLRRIVTHPELRASPALYTFLHGDDETLLQAQQISTSHPDLMDVENIISLRGLISDKADPVISLSTSPLLIAAGTTPTNPNQIPVTVRGSISAPLLSLSYLARLLYSGKIIDADRPTSRKHGSAATALANVRTAYQQHASQGGSPSVGPSQPFGFLSSMLAHTVESISGVSSSVLSSLSHSFSRGASSPEDEADILSHYEKICDSLDIYARTMETRLLALCEQIERSRKIMEDLKKNREEISKHAKQLSEIKTPLSLPTTNASLSPVSFSPSQPSQSSQGQSQSQTSTQAQMSGPGVNQSQSQPQSSQPQSQSQSQSQSSQPQQQNDLGTLMSVTSWLQFSLATEEITNSSSDLNHYITFLEHLKDQVRQATSVRALLCSRARAVKHLQRKKQDLSTRIHSNSPPVPSACLEYLRSVVKRQEIYLQYMSNYCFNEIAHWGRRRALEDKLSVSDFAKAEAMLARNAAFGWSQCASKLSEDGNGNPFATQSGLPSTYRKSSISTGASIATKDQEKIEKIEKRDRKVDDQNQKDSSKNNSRSDG